MIQQNVGIKCGSKYICTIYKEMNPNRGRNTIFTKKPILWAYKTAIKRTDLT